MHSGLNKLLFIFYFHNCSTFHIIQNIKTYVLQQSSASNNKNFLISWIKVDSTKNTFQLLCSLISFPFPYHLKNQQPKKAQIPHYE